MTTKLIGSLQLGMSTIMAGLFLIGSGCANASVKAGDLSAMAQEATSPNPKVAEQAIQGLREAGPAGLETLATACSQELGEHTTGLTFKADAKWERVRHAFDAVGQQRDDYASQLYWFTDLEKAKAAARVQGKPILSLRLLGKLNEEYSCANSRFFRTTLYANTSVATYLREHFILHWQSVRPVPVITIDMGDGRQIKRTITGNSIHYILDEQGRVIDALPGLYGAKAFLTGLQKAAQVEQKVVKLDANDLAVRLKKYHAEQLAEVQREWSQDLVRAGIAPKPDDSPAPVVLKQGGSAATQKVKLPDAVAASMRAMSKTAIERPVLRAVIQANDSPGKLEDDAK